MPVDLRGAHRARIGRRTRNARHCRDHELWIVVGRDLCTDACARTRLDTSRGRRRICCRDRRRNPQGTAESCAARLDRNGRTLGWGRLSARKFAATETLVGASCYAPLLALARLGFAENSIANMEALVDRPLMAVVAINALLVGWVVALRQRPSPRVLVMLGVITALAGAAIAMALYER